MKKRFLLLVLIIGMLMIAGCNSPKSSINSASKGEKVTVYKSPTCGCCVKYIAELNQRGYDVEVKQMQDMGLIKERYNIPVQMESCHTMIIGDYFVEGHVPFEAVEKLINEKPAIDGIALPGMPAASPGMPGIKRESFKIYAITDGNPSEFMTV